MFNEALPDLTDTTDLKNMFNQLNNNLMKGATKALDINIIDPNNKGNIKRPKYKNLYKTTYQRIFRIQEDQFSLQEKWEHICSILYNLNLTEELARSTNTGKYIKIYKYHPKNVG